MNRIINEISNGKIPDSNLTKVNLPSGSKGDAKLNNLAISDFNKMVDAAKNDGVEIVVSQGYRDLGTKEEGCSKGFTQWCAWLKYKSGKGNLAAKPGTSNHGLGCAIDVKNCKTGGKVHTWLTKNAKNYGFKQLPSESWHWDHQSCVSGIKSDSKPVDDLDTDTSKDKTSTSKDSMPKDILNKLEDKKSSTSSSYSGPNLFTALGLFENREFKNKNKIISEIAKIKGMITEGVLTNYPKLTSTSEGALSGTNTYLLDDLNTIYSNNPAIKLSLTAAQGEKNGVYVNAGNATANANLINDLYSKKQYGRTNTENKNKYAINTPQNGVYVYNNTQAATSSNSTTTTTTSSSSTTDSTTKAGGLKVDTSGEGAEMVKSALSSFLGGLGMKESTDEKTLLEEIKKIKKYL